MDPISPPSADDAQVRDRVVQVVVHALMGCPAGRYLDRARLVSVVEDRVPTLLEGERFRIDPVVDGLLRVEGVTEADLYLGLVNLSSQLSHLGIELEPPRLTLDPQLRRRLVKAAAEAPAAEDLGERMELHRRIRRFAAKKLGNLLVEEGLIGADQLAEALEAQAREGGRLGTNLVEQGFLSDEQLAHFLSAQLGVPSLTRLDPIGPAARGALSRELAERHRVVPVRVEGTHLHLAMADPLDVAAIEAVAADTGLSVFPVVAPEHLIHHALERAYGLSRPIRLVGMGTKAPASAEVEGTDTLDLPSLGARLAGVSSELRVLELVQSFLEQRLETSAVFVVHGDRVRGFSHRGALVPLSRFRDTACLYENHGVLRVLASGVPEIYVGPGWDGTGSPWLTDALGLVPESRIAAFSLRGPNSLVGFAVGHLEHGRVQEIPSQLPKMARDALTLVSLRRQLLASVGQNR